MPWIAPSRNDSILSGCSNTPAQTKPTGSRAMNGFDRHPNAPSVWAWRVMAASGTAETISSGILECSHLKTFTISSPPIPGRLMSLVTTSNLCRRASASAYSDVEAPSVWTSDDSPTRIFSVARPPSQSSTTRAGGAMPLPNWPDDRAAWLRRNFGPKKRCVLHNCPPNL